MAPKFAKRKKIIEFVEMAATGPVGGFYPTAVSKYIDSSLEEVLEFLLGLTETEELTLVWELRCPDFSCGNIIELSQEERSNKEIECNKCGTEFELQDSDFYPRFDINPEYKEYIKEENKNKKKQILSLQPH
ncbi:hypothetical protein SAMN04488072_102169 [Lentibacillus halodurans]|uniref:IBR domain-containing protein n=1 Tax=Lentibacillus halodurans TaxID=237679 RepID=A0A1I0W2N3_9BACI|nr:IBR domain-containing protein [Lentibacillus halodurans]SFA82995.1 hypothetical protein SAMN04488072_102169 [Lentibacillus halodurans]